MEKNLLIFLSTGKRLKRKEKLYITLIIIQKVIFLVGCGLNNTARFKNSDLWYFKPSRLTSRLLSHYLKTSDKYQHIYHEWKK